MGRLGTMEIVIIVVVILILFKARKLPEIARSLAKAIREFKKAGKEIESEVSDAIDDKSDNPKS